VTFGVILDIMNTVHPDLKMTGDVPSANPDKKVPVLDMSMYMENNRVMFTFCSP
jgi:hypothetical protein